MTEETEEDGEEEEEKEEGPGRRSYHLEYHNNHPGLYSAVKIRVCDVVVFVRVCSTKDPL